MIVKLKVNGTNSGGILVVLLGLEVTFSEDHVGILEEARGAKELPCSVVVVLASVGLELVVSK